MFARINSLSVSLLIGLYDGLARSSDFGAIFDNDGFGATAFLSLIKYYMGERECQLANEPTSSHSRTLTLSMVILLFLTRMRRSGVRLHRHNAL